MDAIIFSISNFIAVFSILYMLRMLVKFITSFLSNPPKPIDLDMKDIWLNLIFTTYIITYFIQILL